PVPDSPPGVDPQITIVTHAVMPTVTPMPVAVGGVFSDGGSPLMDAGAAADEATLPLPTDPHKLRERIDSDWNTCLSLERTLSGLRQKLSGSLSKLNTLDRELSPQERLAADREDQDAWQDARRWLRDVAAKVHRFVKAHDVGVTSAAGRRNSIEQMVQRHQAKLMSDQEVAAFHHELEAYRKLLSNLQSNMNSALSSAAQDGEGRARRVLQRINVKINQQKRQWRSGK
ncbi:MAG: hypothetical protein KDA85_18145, partial [Planctomycetaceae bacterium]|nr:hypothetical protein [Planctomycetaceae bacterium]